MSERERCWHCGHNPSKEELASRIITRHVDGLESRLAAAESALATCEADTARLDWLEANCDMILNHEQLTQDEYRSPAVVCCLPEDRPLRESIDAWLAPRP